MIDRGSQGSDQRANTDPVLQAILNSGVTLPAPSGSLLQLQSALADERAGPRQLADILRRDPPLTGSLMRVANSPVFRPRVSARSVYDAIVMLGRTKTLAVAVNCALKAQTDGIDPGAVGTIWTSSAAAADWTFRAAQLCGRADLADLAYLTALMHDAGIPVLLRRYPEYATRFVASANAVDAAALTMDAETATDHAAVGALVAQNWKLPTVVAAAIRGHHLPVSARHHDSRSLELAVLVALGRRVSTGASEPWADWQAIAESQLRIDSAMVDTLVKLRER